MNSLEEDAGLAQNKKGAFFTKNSYLKLLR